MQISNRPLVMIGEWLIFYQDPLLLTWFNFNPNMDK